MKPICVIVPAYQEASEVLARTLTELHRTQPDLTIILIDDGSRPALKVPEGVAPLVLLRHALNLGQGAALETGMAYARQLDAAAVVHFDADGQHDARDIAALLAPVLQDQTDVALGSRFLNPESRQAVPRGRRWLLHVARWVEQLITGMNLTDAHCGFRAMGPRALKVIQLKESRMAHATEILQLIRKHKLRYTEVPVHVRYSAYTRAKGQGPLGGVRILWDLLVKSRL